jgi:hypothetical protein
MLHALPVSSSLFSNTISLSFALKVRERVSDPYKTTCKIIVSCISILRFYTAEERFVNILSFV